MRPDAAARHSAIRLADYTPPVWLIDSVRLDFQLHETETRVRSEIAFRLNPDRAEGAPRDLRLDGERLKLIEATVDGAAVSPSIDNDGLTVSGDGLPDAFVWRAEVEINPSANKALEGLYQSNDMFCTQCEAEGFRKITYLPRPPDVMAAFEVRIEADSATSRCCCQTATGGHGRLPGGRHFAEWHDPHPKPCYLFALVAGDLCQPSTTASPPPRAARWTCKSIVRPGDEDKCAYAMDALKRSMRGTRRPTAANTT